MRIFLSLGALVFFIGCNNANVNVTGLLSSIGLQQPKAGVLVNAQNSAAAVQTTTGGYTMKLSNVTIGGPAKYTTTAGYTMDLRPVR